jgi:hypothetical protein
MDQAEEELKRALRTVKRSLEAAEVVTVSPEEATKLLLGAAHQLVFLVEQLIERRAGLHHPSAGF